MSQEKITVVTPTFNRAHTLKRVYESLKKQSYRDFKWLIIDDGSTDDTENLVRQFKSENVVDLTYIKQENSKKFYTVFKAVEMVETDYFSILDSDDAYPEKTLEIMVREADKLNPDEFISLIGHSADENGNFLGDRFPGDGFDGSVLEMRYKYKVKGDKNGLFITKPYLRYLKEFNYQPYKGKYAPQRIFFQIYDGVGMKTRFFNEVVRIYFFDSSDVHSMSAERIKPSAYLGLRDGHLSFINSYSQYLWAYPVPFIRNLIGYLIYSVLMKNNYLEIIKKINKLFSKVLATLLLPLAIIYSKFFITR